MSQRDLDPHQSQDTGAAEDQILWVVTIVPLLTKFNGLDPVLRIRIQDPVPFWPLDPDHISYSFETIFWVKILKFDGDQGEKFRSRIRDGKKSDPGSGIWGSATLFRLLGLIFIHFFQQKNLGKVL
jgi:hypothetical protein